MIKLTYDIDISTILQVTTEHNAKPPLATTFSLQRVIPLMLATVIGAVAFLIGLWANRRGKYLYRRIVVGLSSITTILIAYAFGSTYDQYFKMIKEACSDPSNAIKCNRHAVGIEVIIFGFALGLLFLVIIFWAISSAFFTRKEDLHEEEEPFDRWGFMKKNQASMTPGTMTAPVLLEKQQPYIDNSHQQDELAAWRDVTMFDGDTGEDTLWEEDQKYYKQNLSHDRLNYHDDFNHPKTHRQQGSNRGYKQEQRSNSYLPIGPNDQVSLTPPPPVADQSARGYNKSRVTSSHQPYNTKQRKSLTHDNPKGPQKHRQSNVRQESNDSAMTFGGANHYQHGKDRYRRKSSSRPLSGLESSYQQQRYHQKSTSTKTPTSISPHPFKYPEDPSTGNSFCMTPAYYNEDAYDGSTGSNSSGGGNRGSHYFQSHERRSSTNHRVPILNMPPAAVEHPLSKKVITDKRIQNYLQQSSTPTAPSSSSQDTLKKI